MVEDEPKLAESVPSVSHVDLCSLKVTPHLACPQVEGSNVKILDMNEVIEIGKNAGLSPNTPGPNNLALIMCGPIPVWTR